MVGIKFKDKEMGKIIDSLNFEKLQGIIPVIAVDEYGRVLMLAFMNKEALERTLRTGMMHYWSRSKRRLWMKGEESKHFQYVLGVYTDCDSDSILFKVHQIGPACHTGEYTCFYKGLREYKAGSDIVRELETVIKERMRNPKAGSYTSKVLKAGMKEAAKKLSEEATEVSVAALAEDKKRTVYEAADLLYHLVLLLQMKGVSMDEVYQELWKRRR